MDFFSSTASYRTFTLAARLLSISAYRRRVTKRQLFALDTEKFDPRSLPYRVTNTEQGRIVKISRHAEGGNAMFLHFDGKGRGWRLSFNLCLPRHLFIADVEYALAARIFVRVDAFFVESKFTLSIENLSNIQILNLNLLNLIESQLQPLRSPVQSIFNNRANASKHNVLSDKLRRKLT